MDAFFKVLVILSYIFYRVSSQNSTTAELTSTTAPARTGIGNDDVLNCIYEIDGVLLGNKFDDKEEVETCLFVKYCQKITANYITVGSETNVVMRGCDGFSVPNLFEGFHCLSSGCEERIEDGEYYNVCCCSDHLCNSSHIAFISFLVLILSLLINIY